jgi:hypothetical protein
MIIPTKGTQHKIHKPGFHVAVTCPEVFVVNDFCACFHNCRDTVAS